MNKVFPFWINFLHELIKTIFDFTEKIVEM